MTLPDFETESSEEPRLEELDLVEVESIKRLIQLLTNTLKSLLIYPQNNPLPKEFKRKLYQGLSEFLSSYDELKLEIAPSQILFEERIVYEDGEREEGIAYLMHKEGIRELVFLKGLEQSEVEDFVEVMETCLKSPDLEEDLVTMLWEKDFNNIKYLVVDDLLDVDVPSAQDIPDKWDFDRLFYSEIALVGKETSSETPDRPDSSRQYRQEQTKELLKKLKEFSPEEIDGIQSLLEMDDRYRSLDEFLDILTEILIVEQDFAEFSQMIETVERILDALILIADFPSATKVAERLKGFEGMMQSPIGQKDSLKSKKAERSREVMDGAGEEEKIKKISQILNEKADVDPVSVKEYLLCLNLNSIPAILHMLRDIKDFSARKMVCEVLVKKAKNHLEFLKEGISDQRWYVVRNVVSVLGAIGSEEGLKLLRQCIRHPDVRVRKEVMASLIKTPAVGAGTLLVSFLQDQDKGIRSLASLGLAKRKEKEALPVLMSILEDEQFRDKSPEEKRYLLESFASIGGSEALPLLVKMVHKRSWLKRDKHNETRIFAIGAIGLIKGDEAKEALAQLGKKRNKALRQACENALRRIEHRRQREAEGEKNR
ncbi:MAG: HEAT repeat domain-containing protein [Candidatus Zixiibacteriota bacterium]